MTLVQDPVTRILVDRERQRPRLLPWVVLAVTLHAGVAAAAFVVGADDVVAELKGSFSTTYDFVDHYRGTDKSFDYLIPADLDATVRVGTIVRVELHGRRIGGWVASIGTTASDGRRLDALKPIAKVTGRGPAAEVFELAEWASVRWA